jgi:hypothetical protein
MQGPEPCGRPCDERTTIDFLDAPRPARGLHPCRRDEAIAAALALEAVEARHLHEPWKRKEAIPDYPAPIVDYAVALEDCKRRYAAIKPIRPAPANRRVPNGATGAGR